MLKKVLIMVFGAIFIAGCVFINSGRPKMEIGEIEISNGQTLITPKAYHISTRYKNDIDEHKKIVLTDILDKIPEIKQKVKKDAPVGEEITSDIKVSFIGKYAGDVYYTVYNNKGEEIVKKGTALNIPTGYLDDCVVKIHVLWGKEKNYEEYEYYFKVKYEYV